MAAVGSAFAISDNNYDLKIFMYTLFAAILIQVGTNFANDLLSKGLRNTLSSIPGVAANPLLDTQIFPDPPTTPILLSDGEEVSPTIKFIDAAKAVTLWPRGPGSKSAVQKPKIYHICILPLFINP